MKAIQKKSGQYLGTQIEQEKGQRYSEPGFINYGIGEYWIEDGSLFFQQQDSQQPISLPLHKLVEIEVSPCQKGSGGVPVLKLVWEKDGQWLSSNFVLSGMVDRSNDLLESLRVESQKH